MHADLLFRGGLSSSQGCPDVLRYVHTRLHRRPTAAASAERRRHEDGPPWCARFLLYCEVMPSCVNEIFHPTPPWRRPGAQQTDEQIGLARTGWARKFWATSVGVDSTARIEATWSGFRSNC